MGNSIQKQQLRHVLSVTIRENLCVLKPGPVLANRLATTDRIALFTQMPLYLAAGADSMGRKEPSELSLVTITQ